MSNSVHPPKNGATRGVGGSDSVLCQTGLRTLSQRAAESLASKVNLASGSRPCKSACRKKQTKSSVTRTTKWQQTSRTGQLNKQQGTHANRATSKYLWLASDSVHPPEDGATQGVGDWEALTAYCVKPASRCEALMLRARCDIPDKEDLVMALRQLLNFDRTAVAIFRKMPTRGIDFAAGQRHA